MQLKQLSLTLALAGMLSTQVYAHEAVSEAAPLAAAPVQAAPANVLTQDDLVALFGAEEAGKPLQLAVLSEQEMRETEGAFWLNAAGAFVGGLSGAYSYMTTAALSRQGPSNVGWGLTRSIIGGAAMGAISPVKSIGRAFGTLSYGVASGYGNAFISNRGWRF